MRYIIVDYLGAYKKFEIDKSLLVKVKNGDIEMIIDTEEWKVFKKETKILSDDVYEWQDIKAYDKRFEEE